jgi:hypothetical protein
MPNVLEQLWMSVVGLAMLCPPLLGLLVLGVGLNAVPRKWHLAYGTIGLTVLILICHRIQVAHPNPGPDFAVITSGLFVVVATPLAIGLVCVWVIRLMRARRERDEPDAAT